MLTDLLMSREATEGVPAYAGEKPHKCMQTPLQCNCIAVAVRAEADPEALVSLLKYIVSYPDIRPFCSRLQGWCNALCAQSSSVSAKSLDVDGL